MPPEQVLDRVTGPRRAEADQLIEIHREISGFEPVVWAGRIIGFGEYEYRYASGHSGRAPRLAFATGQAKHTFYLVSGFAEMWPDLVEQFGKCRVSQACLYFTRLTSVDPEALRELLLRTFAHTVDVD